MPANAGTNVWMPLKHLNVVMDHYSLLQNPFIWHRIYKPMPISDESGTYYQTDKRNTMFAYDIARKTDGGFNRIQFGFGKNKYSLDECGLEIAYDQTWLKKYANTPFGGLAYGAMLIDDAISLRHEVEVAKQFNEDENFWDPSQVKVASQHFWEDDFNPQKYFAFRRKEFRKAGSPNPNTMVCSRSVFDWLKMNPYIKADLASEGAGQSVVAADITTDRLCAVLGLKQILIGESTANIAPAGYQGTTADLLSPASPIEPEMVDLWPDDNLFLGYANPGPARFNEVAYGHYLTWSAYAGSSGKIMDKYVNPETLTTVLRQRRYASFHKTGSVHWQKITGVWGEGPTEI